MGGGAVDDKGEGVIFIYIIIVFDFEKHFFSREASTEYKAKRFLSLKYFVYTKIVE